MIGSLQPIRAFFHSEPEIKSSRHSPGKQEGGGSIPAEAFLFLDTKLGTITVIRAMVRW